MMAVAFQSGKKFTPARPLFDYRYAISSVTPSYDVAADGRFLMVKNPAPPPIKLTLGWFEVLKQRLP